MAADPKQEKKHLKIVIIGQASAGEFTITNRLLFDLEGLTDRELEKLKKDAQESGHDSTLFEFYLNGLKEERARGVTIVSTTREFFTPTCHYTIIYPPDHRDFIKNMISGASQADVALLMVSANKDEFETSIAKGNHKKGEIQGQIRQHARLCKWFGIEQLIVSVNKMDDPSVNYDQDRFEEIKSEVEKILTKIGYKTKKIPFIPMSGFKGENSKRVSKNMPWWKGFSVQIEKDTITGVTLMDALEKTVSQPKRLTKKPFRMSVSGVYNIRGVGDVITGRIEQGTITHGVPVRFYPTNATGKAFSIELHHKTVEKAEAGDNVGIHITDLKKENMPHTGDVMCIDDPVVDPNPLKQATKFTALVFVQDHPDATNDGKGNYKKGFTPLIYIKTAKVPCQMLEIKWKMGKATNNAKVENATFIEAGDQAEVVFAPKMPLVVLSFDECKPLGMSKNKKKFSYDNNDFIDEWLQWMRTR
ncbi:translation elongation factor EF-1, subunit alpha [Reticulomyxa filosa]|uniref:Translation elongation factor EF-1, subunit alpha n=1 Tax=Reticulomyxa filosa TaxID=46433 RepID=X6P7L4_RETFI|nr:translation elongation factor EF-1, subunit alpha [Reticulomyxa filosa]|eukprot:ETO34186.1 translation elongation factor EF-1, subunit alpha [Reticulomyxa filosa]